MELLMSKISCKPLVAITLALGIIMLVVNNVAYQIDKESKKFYKIAFIGFAIVYFLSMLFSRATVYEYIFPVLIIICAYMNQKLSFIAVIFSFVINVMNIVKEIILNGGMNDALTKIVSIQIITVVLACIGTYFITIIMAEATEKSLKMTKEQVAIVDHTSAITGEMHGDFDSLKKELFEINGNIHDNTLAMNNITEAVRSTAEEITNQMLETEKIKDDMDNTTTGAEKIYEETNTIVKTLQVGIHHLEDLESQSNIVNDHIAQTTGKLEELTRQIADVANIANSIIDISNQTNLLSLNASIEAARAGEAGRGFAVVSEQIRVLADETKNASEQITEIIEELNNISGETSTSLDNSICSIKQQGKILSSAVESYQHSYDHVQTLTEHVDRIKENLQDTMSANQIIVDTVSSLSSSSEEVVASTNDVNTVTMNVSRQMENFVGKINEMDELMNELNDSVGA